MSSNSYTHVFKENTFSLIHYALIKSIFKFDNPDKLIQKVHFEITEEDLLITKEVSPDGNTMIEVR